MFPYKNNKKNFEKEKKKFCEKFTFFCPEITQTARQRLTGNCKVNKQLTITFLNHALLELFITTLHHGCTLTQTTLYLMKKTVGFGVDLRFPDGWNLDHSDHRLEDLILLSKRVQGLSTCCCTDPAVLKMTQVQCHLLIGWKSRSQLYPTHTPILWDPVDNFRMKWLYFSRNNLDVSLSLTVVYVLCFPLKTLLIFIQELKKKLSKNLTKKVIATKASLVSQQDIQNKMKLFPRCLF